MHLKIFAKTNFNDIHSTLFLKVKQNWKTSFKTALYIQAALYSAVYELN